MDKQEYSAFVFLACVVLALCLLPFGHVARGTQLYQEGTKTFDRVQTPYDVPLNACRYVSRPFRPIDKMYLPEDILMCNTLNVVSEIK